ncbi:hypothetical protein B0H19DRAFT_1245447 [Mycena capillaripes]|nr:hypothetical protein B0H19DRAFT_1245447 [Mycena capillaripes]
MSAFVVFTGPILVGTQLNWALLGVLVHQVFNFYSNFPKEKVEIKALVYWLLLLDLAQTAFTSHFAFGILVSGWGNPEVFSQLPWSSCSVSVLAGFISASVQIFFAWFGSFKKESIFPTLILLTRRIYLLQGRKNRYVLGICGLIVALALMQSISAVVNGIRFALKSQFAELAQLVIGVKIWLIGSAVCDVVIAVTMITILTRYRKMTTWKKTDNIMNKLIYHTVETGAVTAISAIVEVVLFLVYPQYFFHEIPGFVLGKIYSNVVLATLNSRSTIFWGGTMKSATMLFSGNESHQLQWRAAPTRNEEGTAIVVIGNEVTAFPPAESYGKLMKLHV